MGFVFIFVRFSPRIIPLDSKLLLYKVYISIQWHPLQTMLHLSCLCSFFFSRKELIDVFMITEEIFMKLLKSHEI
jgi:hypothetical protein